MANCGEGMMGYLKNTHQALRLRLRERSLLQELSKNQWFQIIYQIINGINQ